MSLSAKCPKCAAVLKVAREMAGKQGKCPRCSAILTIPKLPNSSDEGVKRKRVAAKSAAVSATGAPAQKSTARKRHAANEKSDVQQSRRLLAALQGEIKPVRKAITYRIGIFLVTGVMIVLPLIYVALIGLAGYGVYYHAVNHTGMLEYGRIRAKFFIFLAYLAPLIVGPIMILFMIKPLFARPAREVRRRSLTSKSEPLLFAFVARICQIVGAPEPRRIDVDYQLNASAHFRRSWLSFFGSDLVLTIGIPMAAGLSAKQFTGVLAHEFGHFSQGIGMRLTYIARNINAWFARVVYERDAWDEWLAETAAELDFRVGWILLLSQLGVAISRGVLWILMLIGHAVSGYMLRQMEYDADRYETRVAGTETFARTTHRIRQLGAAFGLAQETMFAFLSQGRIPDDLSTLMLKMIDKIPRKIRRQIRDAVETEKTGIFDSHPSDRDRIASSERENAPGIFHAEGPASLLFSDFEAMSKGVTWDLYSAMGIGIKPQNMDSVEELLKEQEKSPGSALDSAPMPFN